MNHLDRARTARNQLMREARAAARKGDVVTAQNLTWQADTIEPITNPQYERVRQLLIESGAEQEVMP